MLSLIPVISEKGKVGDMIHYQREYSGGHVDDFYTKITFIGKFLDDDVVRIYCGEYGCLVYENDFDKYCEVVKE